MKWTRLRLVIGLFLLAPTSAGSPRKTQHAGDLGLAMPAYTVVEAPDSGPTRSAIIVQGSYRDPQLYVEMIHWSIEGPQDDRDRHGLRAVLKDMLGFDFVDVLKDQEVSEDGLTNALRDAFSPMKGPDNVLYLHWIGHGFVKKLRGGNTGDRHFYTYYSDETDPQNPTRTLSVNNIKNIIDEAKEAWLGDADVKIALCFDACASDGLSRGREVVSVVRSLRFDLEAFSAGQGKKALPERTGSRDRRSMYTGALADRLWELGRAENPVDLRRAFLNAAEAASGQSPSTDGESLNIFNPKDSMLAVRVVRSDSRDETLTTAKVELESEGRRAPGGDVVFRGLRVPGVTGYRLHVSAPGYHDRHITVMARNKLIKVPLVRDFDLLRVEVLARRGAETTVEVVGGAAARMGPNHNRSRTARGSQWLRFAIPTGLQRVKLEARSEGVADVSKEIDLASLVAEKPEAMLGLRTEDAREGNPLDGVTQYTVRQPLFVSAEQVRLSVHIDRDIGPKFYVGVVGQPESRKQIFGSKDLHFDVPYMGLEVALEIRRDSGELLREVPFSLGSPTGTASRGQLTLPVFALDEINLKPQGAVITGMVEFGGEAETVKLTLLPRSDDALTVSPSGAFRLEVDTDAEVRSLYVEGHGAAPVEVPIDMSGGELTYFDSEGRMLRLVDLGRIVLDAQAKGNQDASVAAPDGFWEHLQACEAALDRRDTKSAEKSLKAAKKLLPSKKDERYAFIYYYEALSAFVEAKRYKSQKRESWYRKASTKFEKVCKGDSQARNPDGVSARAMSWYYVGYLRARDMLAYPKRSEKALREATAARDTLLAEFPDDTNPEGDGLVQRLDAEISKMRAKLGG